MINGCPFTIHPLDDQRCNDLLVWIVLIKREREREKGHSKSILAKEREREKEREKKEEWGRRRRLFGVVHYSVRFSF